MELQAHDPSATILVLFKIYSLENEQPSAAALNAREPASTLVLSAAM